MRYRSILRFSRIVAQNTPCYLQNRHIYLTEPTHQSTTLKNNFSEKSLYQNPVMAESVNYEDAVHKLNGLQTNAAVIQENKGQGLNARTLQNVDTTRKFLSCVGIDAEDIDKLPVIHVTGTKGKGSTCAFTEQILRQHGYRTGLFTSPHLVSVTERIRLDGKPIEKKEFAKYFFSTYNTLFKQKENEADMPAYFKFLTVLAFKIFIEEEVDVAILEVGIGGEYDCTNVVRNPVVCGIASLDYDHTSILGNTLTSIAWNKSGIMKQNAPVFTVSGHQEEALVTLISRAKEKQSPLFECPPLQNYGWYGRPIHLGLAGDVQLSNASLALQLTNTFLKWKNGDVKEEYKVEDIKIAPTFSLSEDDLLALRDVSWPGRSQIFKLSPKFTLFLDGAHTPNSMEACCRWFNDLSSFHSKYSSQKVSRILIFNTTGDRDPQILLSKLVHCNFDLTIFTTNLVSMKASNIDQTNLTVSESSQHLRCHKHFEVWNFLKSKLVTPSDETKNLKDYLAASKQTSVNQNNDLSPGTSSHSLDATHMLQLTQMSEDEQSAVIIPTIKEVFDFIQSEGNSEGAANDWANADKVQILVTGSLHLVGGLLGVLETELGPMSLSDKIRTQHKKNITSTPGTP